MQLLSPNDLKLALLRTEGPCVSVYLNKPSRYRRGSKMPTIRLAQLLRDARSLLSRTFEHKEVEDLVEPFRTVQQEKLWEHENRAIALFRSPSLFGMYPLEEEVGEIAIVSESFHIKPIIRDLQKTEGFLVLVLSQRKAELYHAFGKRLERMAAILSLANSRSQDVKYQGRRSDDLDPSDLRKESVTQFFREVDRQVGKIVNERRLPIILAGVSYLHPIFRSVSSNKFLLDQGIEGSLERRAPARIYEEARELIQEYMLDQERKAAKEFLDALPRQQGSDDLGRIVQYALSGRVRKLIIAGDRQVWGVLNREKSSVVLHPKQSSTRDEDVLDDLAEVVLSTGGEVVVIPSDNMPTHSPVAAILRWA